MDTIDKKDALKTAEAITDDEAEGVTGGTVIPQRIDEDLDPSRPNECPRCHKKFDKVEEFNAHLRAHLVR